ncbi:hypothetical protein RYA05_01910 [Pseudomonas syringae pv. actinidiae]|nr:hypothetical protein [Pseudomonas syringae pv. actinidiae]
MKTVDATPPADTPAIMIVIEADVAFVQRNPSKAYYLRVRLENNDVDIVNLDDCYSLPAARKMARDKGFEPTHWIRTSERTATQFY